MLRKLTKEYNGMEFEDLVVSASPLKLEVVVSALDKLVVERPLTLQIHRKACKYRPELLLSSWSLQYPKLQPRGVIYSPYWRSEQILTPVEDTEKVRQWRDFFFDVANSLDCVLKGIIKV